jgi:Homeodomain-like domain
MLQHKREGLMAKRSRVTLSADERAHLLALTKKGTVAARQLTRAHILLQADAGGVDTAIATALHIGTATVERMRTGVVEEGLDAALSERPRPGGRGKLEGKPEALLVALACRTPPEERPRWTMPRWADTRVALQQVESIADETGRRTLKNTSSRRG